MDIRTTVDLPAEDLTRLKIRAAELRTSVKSLVREAIKQYLVGKDNSPQTKKEKLAAAWRLSDNEIQQGMEPWGSERISAEVAERRGTDKQSG